MYLVFASELSPAHCMPHTSYNLWSLPRYVASLTSIAVQAVPENKNKPAIVNGLCIAKKNRGFRTSFTLLNHLGTYGQVERIFPL